MTMSFAQNEPAFAARCYSSARRAPSDQTLCQLLCAAHLGSPADKLAKNPCNSDPLGKLAESSPKAFGNLLHYGRQFHRRRPVESADIEQSRPSVYWLFLEQMTTIHPTPRSFPPTHQGLAGLASPSTGRACRLFFEPTADRVAGDAKSASQAAQRRAFFVGTQNRFAFGVAIANRLRIMTTATLAVFTVIALFAISGQPVAKQIFTAAMTAFNRDRNHRMRLTSLTLLNHYPFLIIIIKIT
jgi:hypothetical protein